MTVLLPAPGMMIAEPPPPGVTDVW